VSAQVAVVRAWWRVKRPGPTLGARLDLLYTIAITTGILGALLYGTASSALSRWITPVTVPEWGPAIVLVGLATTARWGTWQGPVVFAEADVGFLLGAPLSRRALAVRPFARALAWGAVAGAVVAAVALVGLAGRGRGVGAGDALGLVLGLALVGTLGVALAGVVQCSARASRAAALALPLSIVAAAGLVAAARSSAGARTAVLWSGPWGWAIQPVAGDTAAAIGALAGLAVASALAIVAAARALGACPTERHVVRAEAQAGARASAWAFDARTARQGLQRAAGSSAGRARLAGGLRPPRRPVLAIVWRDATSGLRAPGRTLGAAAIACSAGALAIAAARHPAADAIAPLGTYLAAGLVLEPLRLEVDHPSASRILLRRPWGRVLLDHVAIPVAVVATATALAGALVAVIGDLPAHGGAIVLVAVAVVPTVVLCAALSARHGGRVPISVLATGAATDPTGGGGTVIAWWLRWPIAATVVAGLALVFVRPAVALSSGLPAALLIAAIAPAVLGAVMLGTER
jgi:hypothetical protein